MRILPESDAHRQARLGAEAEAQRKRDEAATAAWLRQRDAGSDAIAEAIQRAAAAPAVAPAIPTDPILARLAALEARNSAQVTTTSGPTASYTEYAVDRGAASIRAKARHDEELAAKLYAEAFEVLTALGFTAGRDATEPSAAAERVSFYRHLADNSRAYAAVIEIIAATRAETPPVGASEVQAAVFEARKVERLRDREAELRTLTSVLCRAGWSHS
jgi:hypothetical protein